MRKRIAAGNWKMNKTASEAEELVDALSQTTIPSGTEVILGIPNIYLATLKSKLLGSSIKVAAQNCHEKDHGAYTGEISASMLQSVGVDAVIIGHSERRAYFGETDEQLAEKVNSVLSAGMEVIFCCGEPLEIREAGTHVQHVEAQLKHGLFHVSAEDLSRIIIAYEPIWAIGTGVTASPEQAQEMHAAIRAMVDAQYGGAVATEIHILYGGSVKPSNATELFGQNDVDGGLVGGASLKADDFSAIIGA